LSSSDGGRVAGVGLGVGGVVGLDVLVVVGLDVLFVVGFEVVLDVFEEGGAVGAAVPGGCVTTVGTVVACAGGTVGLSVSKGVGCVVTGIKSSVGGKVGAVVTGGGVIGFRLLSSSVTPMTSSN
jgi:hypothetical protein